MHAANVTKLKIECLIELGKQIRYLHMRTGFKKPIAPLWCSAIKLFALTDYWFREPEERPIYA